MWTKMSGVPSPRVRKPKPRRRLNHLTTAGSSPLVGVTCTCVRGSGSSEGWSAVELVEGDDPERLQPARPLHGLDHDAGALVGGLIAVPAQAGHVQEHIRHAVVRHDEAEALRDVEPLDAAADLDEVERALPRNVLRRLLRLPSVGLRLSLRSYEPEPKSSDMYKPNVESQAEFLMTR